VWKIGFVFEIRGNGRFGGWAEGGRGCGFAVLEASGPGRLGRKFGIFFEVLHCGFSMHGGAGKMVIWRAGFQGKRFVYIRMRIFVLVVTGSQGFGRLRRHASAECFWIGVSMAISLYRTGGWKSVFWGGGFGFK
jgi:hypothetical protein